MHQAATGRPATQADIGKPGCRLGQKLKVPVYQFLKEALVRKYGEDFYEGLDAVAKAAPDGSTLGVASPINHLAAPSLYPKLPYDSVKDFSPVAHVASQSVQSAR